MTTLHQEEREIRKKKEKRYIVCRRLADVQLQSYEADRRKGRIEEHTPRRERHPNCGARPRKERVLRKAKRSQEGGGGGYGALSGRAGRRKKKNAGEGEP